MILLPLHSLIPHERAKHMRKHIWILNHYAGGMFFDQGGRHYNFAKYLKRFGYEPVVFCANSKHGKLEEFFDTQEFWDMHTAEEIGVPWVFVRARTYKGNGTQRILNMIDFYRNVKKAAREYAVQYGKPDVIYASSVHPLTLVAGIQLAKQFGVKCVCEVRDLWPESMTSLYPERFPRNSLLIRLLYRGEKWIYQRADSLIFTMEGGKKYILDRGWEKSVLLSKIFYINNGVDLEVFDQNQECYLTSDADLDDPDTFKLIYAGTIRLANGLVQLLECAEQLRKQTAIRFLVYGTGEDLEEMQALCKKKQLTNVVFKGVVEKRQIPYILSKCNVDLLNNPAESQDIFQYGGSNNKMFEYLASGKPILANVRIAYCPLEQLHCGIFADSPSGEDYAGAVMKIFHMPPEEYASMCRDARKAAAEYDFKNLTKKLIAVLEG